MATKNTNIFTNKTSVLIATFAPFENGVRLPNNGMIEPMLSFFLPKIKKMLVIVQPHVGSDRIDPIIEEYRSHKLSKKWIINKLFYFPLYLLCKAQNDHKTHISFKLRDLFSVLFVGFISKQKYTYFIGLESINTIGGIILKKFGKVENVIYYVSDYSPSRFKKAWFNTIYIWLDRFCVLHADYIWDVSPAMQDARVEAGLEVNKLIKQLIVPNALFPSQIASLPIAKRVPFSVVFMGTLGPENGPVLAIEAIPLVRKKFPRAKLHIVGGGKHLDTLEKLVKKLQIEKDVIFHGYFSDLDKLAEIVRTCSIAVAPYRAIPDSVRWYADATKIRQYLASGLPVVSTHVPPLGKYVASKGAAIVVKDTKKELAEGIIKIFSDEKLYATMTAQAKKFSKENTWENVYRKAFMDMAKLDNEK